MGWDISLSPSKLGIYRECTRCFYDANVLKIDRPRGIFPSLPGGVDRVMKTVVDQYRGGLPPSLQHGITGVLWGSVEQINKLRNWRSGLKALIVTSSGRRVNLIGALDDLIQESDGTYSPYDVKTKGDVPKDDGAQYYGRQLDCYALLLAKNGMKPSGKAYLDYHYPVGLTGESMTWGHQLYTLTADPDRAVKLIEEAVAVLIGDRPAVNPSCEYCKFAEARKK